MSGRFSSVTERRAARLEADAVVGRDDDEGAIVETGLLETSQQRTDEPVDVADLQEVLLQRLVDEELRRAPSTRVVLDRLGFRRALVLASRREERRRAVRKQRVLDVEDALPGRGPQRPKEAEELRALLTPRRHDRREPGIQVERTEHSLTNVDVGAFAKPAPALADRRQPTSERAREHAVQVPDGHVVQQPTLAIEEGHLRASPGAVARRAEARHLLERANRVALPEQSEQVVGVILQRRQLSLSRELPRQDRRDGVGRGVVHGGRPRIPGAVACEPREARIPDRVEGTVGPRQRAHRELVEHHEYDRNPCRRRRRRRPPRRRRRAAPSRRSRAARSPEAQGRRTRTCGRRATARRRSPRPSPGRREAAARRRAGGPAVEGAATRRGTRSPRSRRCAVLRRACATGARRAPRRATTTSGGTTARSRANTITSQRVDPRTTRNSGFPFNIEKTGWPTPYAHNAARCANRHRYDGNCISFGRGAVSATSVMEPRRRRPTPGPRPPTTTPGARIASLRRPPAL